MHYLAKFYYRHQEFRAVVLYTIIVKQYHWESNLHSLFISRQLKIMNLRNYLIKNIYETNKGVDLQLLIFHNRFETHIQLLHLVENIFISMLFKLALVTRKDDAVWHQDKIIPKNDWMLERALLQFMLRHKWNSVSQCQHCKTGNS